MIDLLQNRDAPYGVCDHGVVLPVGQHATHGHLPSHLWPRPRFRGVLHAVGAFALVPLGLALVLGAPTGRARVAVAVYALAQLAVFATSASYHRLAKREHTRRRMQLADHSMIYVLIAGTWVPVCLLAMPGGVGGWFLAGIGTAAAIGIGLKLVGVDRFPRSANAIYIVMGWAGLLALPVVLPRMAAITIMLMAAGGVAYTLGAVILMLKRPDPRPTVFGYHEVWHACTVLAAVCHFAMVWQLAGAAVPVPGWG